MNLMRIVQPRHLGSILKTEGSAAPYTCSIPPFAFFLFSPFSFGFCLSCLSRLLSLARSVSFFFFLSISIGILFYNLVYLIAFLARREFSTLSCSHSTPPPLQSALMKGKKRNIYFKLTRLS